MNANEIVKELRDMSTYDRGFEQQRDTVKDAADLIESLQAQTKVTGETSDGYHTFNELYHHRAVLFSVICNDRPTQSWKSKLHHDGTMYDGMFIVGIQTPSGQATYHYDIDPYWDMFQVPELSNAPGWDGHTPAQAIERIGKLPSLQAENTQLKAELAEYNCDTKVGCKLIEEVKAERDAAIKQLQESQRWIPVSERLPEASGAYWVNLHQEDEDGNDADFCIEAWYQVNSLLFAPKEVGWQLLNEWYEFSGQMRQYISHWMPLPKLPEKGAEHDRD